MINTCFYPLSVFQVLYSYNGNRQEYISQFGLDQVQLFSDFIYEKLSNLVKKRIEVFCEKDLIKTEMLFYTNTNKAYTVQEIQPLEQEILAKHGWANKNWMYAFPIIQQQFFKERTLLFQKKFRTKDILSREEYHFLPGNSNELQDFKPLNNEQLKETLYIFTEYLRERLLYQARNNMGSSYEAIGPQYPKELTRQVFTNSTLLQRYTNWSLPHFQNLLIFNEDKYIDLNTFLQEHTYRKYNVNNIRYLK